MKTDGQLAKRRTLDSPRVGTRSTPENLEVVAEAIGAHRGQDPSKLQVQVADVSQFPSLRALFGGRRRAEAVRLLTSNVPSSLSSMASAPCRTVPDWTGGGPDCSPQGWLWSLAVPVQSASGRRPADSRPKQSAPVTKPGLGPGQGHVDSIKRPNQLALGHLGGSVGRLSTEALVAAPTVSFQKNLSRHEPAKRLPYGGIYRPGRGRFVSAAWPPRCKAYPTWCWIARKRKDRGADDRGTQGVWEWHSTAVAID